MYLLLDELMRLAVWLKEETEIRGAQVDWREGKDWDGNGAEWNKMSREELEWVGKNVGIIE